MKQRLGLHETGQMTMEMILIMSVLTATSLLVMKTMREKQFAATLVEGPWKPVRGMIENGVWLGDSSKAKTFHPSVKSRHATAEGNNIPQR